MNEYLEKIKLNAIIYDDNIEEDFTYGEYINYVLKTSFVERLYVNVIANETLQIYDEEVKDNIRKVVSFIRHNIKENRSNNIALLNKIIVSLNVTSDINSDLFYMMELSKRQGQNLDKSKSYMENNTIPIENYKEALRYSLTQDYDTIIELLTEDENIFVDEIVKNELLNDLFICTLNAVFEDNKQLFDDETFRRRSIYVLKSIKEVYRGRNEKYTDDQDLDIDKITKKNANKMLKKIKRR